MDPSGRRAGREPLHGYPPLNIDPAGPAIPPELPRPPTTRRFIPEGWNTFPNSWSDHHLCSGPSEPEDRRETTDGPGSHTGGNPA
jgi:hypothetical protein